MTKKKPKPKKNKNNKKKINRGLWGKKGERNVINWDSR